MAILQILQEGDETLRKKSRPVDTITDRTLTLIDDMRDTLIKSGGVGLAAPQVGVLRRIVLCIDDNEQILEMINPEIVKESGEQEELEGCLSIPGKWGITHRPMKVTVKAQDRTGKLYTVKGEALLAREFCHEIDHLDGILFVDKAVHMLTPEEMEEISQ